MDEVEFGCVPEKKELRRMLYTSHLESTCVGDHVEIADAIQLRRDPAACTREQPKIKLC